MELRQLEIFRVLAAELNFTRTAERVHCVQSNVTVQIRALETELGVSLFERLGKRVRLTEEGRNFLCYAERALDLLQEAKSAVATSEEPSGLLRIAAPESVLTYRLPSVLAALREQYPAIELSFVAESCSRLWSQLERGVADVVLSIDDSPENPNIKMKVLCQERMALLVQPGHPLAARRQVTVTDLAGQTMLLTEEDCAYRRKLQRLWLSEGIKPAAVLDFNSVEAIKQCASLGMGVAHLPMITAEGELSSGKLVALRWGGPSLTMHTLVAHHKDKWQSPAMRAFLALVDERFRTIDAGIKPHRKAG